MEYRELDEISRPGHKSAALITLLIVTATCAGVAFWTVVGTSPSKHVRSEAWGDMFQQGKNASRCPSIPTTTDWAVKHYCGVSKLDKTLVTDSSCKYWFYSYAHGTPGTDDKALSFCKKYSVSGRKLSGCHVEDRRGSACHSHTRRCSKIPLTTDGWVTAYCNKNSVDKTLVADASCKTWRYDVDKHDTDDGALNICHKTGASGCHIEDRGGRRCFSCSDSLVKSRYSAKFKAYCAAPTPKQWFMSSNCRQARWTRGRTAAPPGMKIWSHDGGLCPCTKLKSDMRCKMQACLQYRKDWCWATVTTIIAGYYHPDRYPNRDESGPNCRGVQCHIIGEAHHGSPEACCLHKDKCAAEHARTWSELDGALTKYTGLKWKTVFVIPPKSLLVKILRDGNPVMMGIKYVGKYAKYGTHVMIIAGTDGKGVFYVHDPLDLRGRGSFQSLSYSGLLHYKTPGYPYQGDFGSGTMFAYTALAKYKAPRSFFNSSAALS